MTTLRSPNIKIIESNKNVVKFEVTDITMGEANTIRKKLMNIPTLAIERVEIIINGSEFIDEVLAHRLGLVPILSPAKISSNPTDEELNLNQFAYLKSTDFSSDYICPCNLSKNEHCMNCNQSYEIDITCPASEKYIDITSSDIRRVNGDKISKLFPDIVITRLKSNHQLHIKCRVKIGTANIHAKWSPFAVIFYDQKDKDKDTIVFKAELVGSISPENFESYLSSIQI